MVPVITGCTVPDSHVGNFLSFPPNITNIIVLPVDTTGGPKEVLKHEIGHVLTLSHLGIDENLMCGSITSQLLDSIVLNPSECTPQKSIKLEDDQADTAKGAALLLTESPR